MGAPTWESQTTALGRQQGRSLGRALHALSRSRYSVVLNLVHLGHMWAAPALGRLPSCFSTFPLFLRKKHASANEQERCYYRDKDELILPYSFFFTLFLLKKKPFTNLGIERSLVTLDRRHTSRLMAAPQFVANMSCLGLRTAALFATAVLHETLPWRYKIIAV